MNRPVLPEGRTGPVIRRLLADYVGGQWGLSDAASNYSVQNGVGTVTTRVLLKHVVKAARLQNP